MVLIFCVAAPMVSSASVAEDDLLCRATTSARKSLNMLSAFHVKTLRRDAADEFK